MYVFSICLILGFVTLKMTKVPEGKQDNVDHLKASPLSHPLLQLHPLLQSSYMAKSKDNDLLCIYSMQAKHGKYLEERIVSQSCSFLQLPIVVFNCHSFP